MRFKIGDATVYNKVFKQILTQAKAITPHGIDMAKLLVTGKDVDFTQNMPTQQEIEEDDAKKRSKLEAEEAKRFDFLTKRWIDRCDHYEQNKTVLCGIIAEKCGVELDDRLQGHPGYFGWTLDNPLLYLKMIKEECVGFRQNENPCAIQLKLFQDLHGIAQGKQESVAEYYKRVRVHWELLTTTTTINYNRINPRLHQRYDTSSVDDKMILNRITDEMFVSYIMTIGADPSRFGEMINNLEKGYAVGNRNYPTTLKEAKEYLDSMTDMNTKSQPLPERNCQDKKN
jgi:hypothetical protein